MGTNHLMTIRNYMSQSPDSVMFYELEPAVVLDVIRDEDHPVFKDKVSTPRIKEQEWPEGFNWEGDIDYSWIGRIKARMLYSQNKSPLNELSWILPMETAVKEYPLVNEVVIVAKYVNNIYYTRRLNSRNFLNNSADFRTEPRYGANNRLDSGNCPNLVGARNISNISPASNDYGQYLGKYFKANNKVRPLKHFEGDTVYESRFGSSIRFGCYEDNTDIDIGTTKGNGDEYNEFLGNPKIIIRNRQRPRREDENIYQHTIQEDINEDGSSIWITSGKTVVNFTPTLTGPNPPQPKKQPTAFAGLAKLANSAIGTGIINSPASPSSAIAAAGKVAQTALNVAETVGKAYVQQQLAGPMAAANIASKVTGVENPAAGLPGGSDTSPGGSGLADNI